MGVISVYNHPTKGPLFFVAERSFSLGFTCLYTGNYGVKNHVYIKRLLMNCTEEEARVLSSLAYDDIVAWMRDRNTGEPFRHRRGYATKYERLIKGESGKTIAEIYEECVASGFRWHPCAELEFPKGRPASKREEPHVTAMREFVEETSIPPGLRARMMLDVDDPSIETYKGLDGSMYRCVYYTHVADRDFYEAVSALECSSNEVRRMMWLSLNDFKRAFGRGPPQDGQLLKVAGVDRCQREAILMRLHSKMSSIAAPLSV